MRAFQAGDGPQLLVCSTLAAGHGITLTRASNVAFLELEWTPAPSTTRPRTAATASASTTPSPRGTCSPPARSTRRSPSCCTASAAIVDAVTDGRRDDGEGLVDEVVRALREDPVRHLRAVPA